MDHLIDLTISLAERVSIAFHQNAIPIASEIVISNRCEQELAEVVPPAVFGTPDWSLRGQGRG